MKASRKPRIINRDSRAWHVEIIGSAGNPAGNEKRFATNWLWRQELARFCEIKIATNRARFTHFRENLWNSWQKNFRVFRV